MLTNSDVLNVDVMDSEFCAAVESRSAARDAANTADFQYRASMEVCEHAINLKRALTKNRFYEEEKEFAPLFRRFMKMQHEAQDVYRNADAAFQLVHKTVEKSRHELDDARIFATSDAPEENVPSALNERNLKEIR